jgi:hypothetical protein
MESPANPGRFKKLLCDEESRLCDEDVTKQSHAGDGVTKYDHINSSVKNTVDNWEVF